jgi:MraZ protein
LFSGAHSHAVDNKGRTVIPSKFRSKLGERLYVTRGMHGCLWLFSEDAWREFQQMLTPKSPLDSKGLTLERIFVGLAVECVPDVQGRIFIPQNLRDVAGITDDIWIVGLTGKLEIWSDARWKQFNGEMTVEMIEQLGEERLQKPE